MGFEIESSGTVKIFDIAKQLESEGRALIHLEVGELDFRTPEYVIEATVASLQAGRTRYTTTKGHPALRAEIARYTERRYGVPHVDPATQVLVTPGAKYGLFLGLLSTLQPGDEVLVFSPSYPSFRAIPAAIHTTIKEIPILAGHQTIPTREIFADFQEKLTHETRVFILNGPCNPTGQVIGPELVHLIWEHVQAYPRLVFLADDIYEQYIYPPATFETPAHHDPSLARTILINGLSKSMCMTGFRVGWVVSSEQFVTPLQNIQQNSVTCVPEFIQDAARVALQAMNRAAPRYTDFRAMVRDALDARRRYLVQRLQAIPGIQCNDAEGAFYVFPDVSAYDPDDWQFAMDLLARGVVVTPGSAFGLGGAGHVRICYTQPLAQLQQAMDILTAFLRERAPDVTGDAS